MIPVKLPKEVLNLFPTWEYRCPRCSTYVESNKSFCPNCKTPFDEKKWRVPPRFLKSHDAMSKYAHKVLAPKLTPKQRELLFQYFTDLFSDGQAGSTMETSSNFDAWDGTTGNPEVSTNQAHHGSNSARINAVETVYKNITSTAEARHIRCYVYFVSLPTSNNYQVGICGFAPAGFHGYPFFATAYKDPADSKVKFALRDAYFNNWSITSIQPSSGQWYCVEVKYVKGGTGSIEIGGNPEATLGCPNVNTDYAFIGSPEGTQGEAHIDCIVVADTHIGQETTTQTYTKTWTTDALFKKLGIPKTLGVDAAFQKQDTLKTFGINADFLKRDLIKSFTVDARFGALITQTIARQIDVLLKKLDVTKNFGLDAYFGSGEAETYSITFGLSAIFAYKVRLPELWLDENGKIVLNTSKPYTWVGS